MTALNQGKKKKKINYTASLQGVKRAENALKRLGFESKSNFAKSKLLSRSTVTKFFQRQPIQFDSFRRICEALTLNWTEIAEILEEEQLKKLEINNCSSLNTNKGVRQVQAPPIQGSEIDTQKFRRQVIVVDKQSKKIKASLVIEGDINSVNNDLLVALELCLQKYSGDTVKIVDITEGSIRLIIEGSQDEIERLVSRIRAGELEEVDSFPIEDIQILSESSDDSEDNDFDKKWLLVREIVTQSVEGRNLTDADLSDADLSNADLSLATLIGADLSDADLSNANLSDANLSGANLSGTNLSDANLSRVSLHDAVIDKTTRISHKWRLVWEIINQPFKGRNLINANLIRADLSNADLSNADLSGADLSGADLSGANLSGANLSDANLSGANLSDANLRFADLSGADLSSACLFGTDLSGTDLRGAYLFGANLFGANLSGADLRFANLTDATLTSTDLFGANLFSANLSSADLSGSDLSGVYLRFASLSGADLSGANLSGADLRFANLTDVDLSNANLQFADLRGATNLSSAQLSKKVKGARFVNSKEISELTKRELIENGAIFEDFPGDRESMYSPVNR